MKAPHPDVYWYDRHVGSFFSVLLTVKTEMINHLFPQQSWVEAAQRWMVEEHKNNDIYIYICEERFKIAFRRKDREREGEKTKIPLLKILKHADFFVAELYPRLMLFIINYMVVIYFYQVFKKLARLMKNA